MITRALIYCRVSSQRQVQEGHGLDSQEQRCRSYAQNKDYQVVAIFPDEGISGKLFERPAMKRLIAYLDAHPLEKFVIIFDDLSRFAREVQTHIQLKTELVSRGAKLECLNFNFDDSEESEFAELILAASNQYQRKSNRRQVIQKMKARLEKGYWAFMPPLGLKNYKDPVHGNLLKPVEPHASIIKESIEKFRDGFLVTKEDVRQHMHDLFKKAGLPNRPALSSVQELLRDPLYAGYIEYKKWGVTWRKAAHSGIVSADTFWAVQERLAQRAKPWKRRDYSLDFPLRLHVLCASCGKPFTGSWNKGRKERYPNYFCRAEGCRYRWKVVRKSKMELAFEELLIKAAPAREFVDLTKEILKEEWDKRVVSFMQQKQVIDAEIKEADTAVKSYLDLIRKTKDEELRIAYEQELKDFIQKKKLAQQKLQEKRYTSDEFGTATEKVCEVLKDPLSMWKSDDYNDKKTILFMYFGDNLRYDYHEGFGTANLTAPLRLINTIKDDQKSSSTESVEMSDNESESEKYFQKRLQA
jgi:site-specific DNA recombinase